MLNKIQTEFIEKAHLFTEKKRLKEYLSEENFLIPKTLTMKIHLKEISIRELTKNYKNNQEE
jgi:hypothetical protein